MLVTAFGLCKSLFELAFRIAGLKVVIKMFCYFFFIYGVGKQ